MANYPKILMTTRGLSLISEANATNQALIFTKIMLGDGDIGEDSIRNLTALKNPKMELTLSGGTNLGNGQFQIRASCSNAGLNTGFFAREVGVYAKVGTSGNEKLIAYTNGGNFVDYIPDKSTPIDSQIFKIDIVVGDVENLTVQVKDETFLTQAELDEHNRNAGAHENRFSLYEKIGNLGKDVINKLALTTTISAISALQTNSWFGQLLKMVLTASGVKYHIANNGYVCLGSFFGGLIIQWIKCDLSRRDSTTITPPLNMNTCFCGTASDAGMARYSFGFDQNRMTLYSPNSSSTFCNLIMVGKI